MQTIEAMRSPKIETIVAQHPWLENDCLLADLILPANTTFEVLDLVPNTRPGELLTCGLQRPAIPPLGESKSDLECVVEVAKKLGLADKVLEGKTREEWLRFFFDEYFKLNKFISWEEFLEKEYVVFQTAEDWEQDPPGFRKFYEDPEHNPLPTPSGKLEVYSESLAVHFPQDEERPPVPKWIEKGVTHDERISSDRARVYPLLMMSNHGRWRVHAQCDDITWTREVQTCKITGPDGYKYEPLWLHPTDAAKRGIRTGDIVQAYNERGTVLCGALVTERVMPGVAYVDHGARCDFIIPGKLDRGGAINLISPRNIMSQNCPGQATSGYLCEVQKVTATRMEEWRKLYPEAFERKYDPASGLRFDGWIEGGSDV